MRKTTQKCMAINKAVSHFMSDYDENEKPKTKLKDLKYKGKSDTREDNEKQQIFTFNELLTKVDSENPNTFKPCTISLRKIDARNRKILEDYPTVKKPIEEIKSKKPIKTEANRSTAEVEEIKPALTTVQNFMLTDQEKREAFIKQEGYQDMLEYCLSSEYRPGNDLVDTMKFYQN